MSFDSYVASLNLPFAVTEMQALNGLAFASTLTTFYTIWPGPNFKKQVEREAGEIVEMPPGKQGELVTAAHIIGIFPPILTFLIGLPVNKFVTPNWMLKYTLPPVSFKLYYGARIAGCIGSLGVGITMNWGMKHLASQWHYVGLRERPRLVNTGPYAFVRHPMYLCGMSLGIFFAGMFWSWIPLAGACLAILSFFLKIPIEEKVMLKNKKMGDAYKRYQKEVPYRLVPYVW